MKHLPSATVRLALVALVAATALPAQSQTVAERKRVTKASMTSSTITAAPQPAAQVVTTSTATKTTTYQAAGTTTYTVAPTTTVKKACTTCK